MFVVIIDNKLTESWSECDSLLKLPIFSENLLHCFLRSVSRLSPQKIVIFSQNDIKNVLPHDVDFIDNKREFLNYFLGQSDETSIVFSSGNFIDIDDEFIKIIRENKEDYKFVSTNNEDLCCVLYNRNMVKILSEYSVSFDNIFNDIEQTEIYNGYSKNIEKPLIYKAFLDDILNRKTSVVLPEIAQGIYAEDRIPNGNFVIIPPVYFDSSVQVEDGAVIGPGSILMSETLVSKESEIKNSILMCGVYISSGCYVDNSLLCENVTVRRNSVVMNNSVLGHNSVIGEETVVENNSVIKPYTKVDDIKQQYVNFKKETTQSPAGFYGYSPEKAALLGAAIGQVFNRPRVAIASDGEMNSTALKFALLSGLITTGAACYDFGNTFLSSMHYFMEFCELDCAVFVSGNKLGTFITVFTKNTYSLTSAQYYNIKAMMLSDKIIRCDYDECKNIRQIHGMSRMYVQNLIKNFSSKLDLMPVFNSDNKRIQSVVEIAASKIGYATGKKRLVFNINSEGTKATVEYENMLYPENKIKEIVEYFNGNNAVSTLWKLDCLILSFELLRVLHENNLDLKSASNLLPQYYVAESSLKFNNSLSKLINKFGEKSKVEYKSGDIFINNGNNKIRINKKDDELRIVAKAASVEIAKEMVGDILKIISSM